MRVVVPASIALGLAWNLIARFLMGARHPADLFEISGMLAGALAGMAAGAHTLRTRDRAGAGRRFLDGLATYYLGMVVYWIGFVLIERVRLCVEHGGWTDLGLREHLRLIVSFGLYGTLWYGIALIPLALLSRALLIRLHDWSESRAAGSKPAA